MITNIEDYLRWEKLFYNDIGYCYFSNYSTKLLSNGTSNKWIDLARKKIEHRRSLKKEVFSYYNLLRHTHVPSGSYPFFFPLVESLLKDIKLKNVEDEDLIFLTEVFYVLISSEVKLTNDSNHGLMKILLALLNHLKSLKFSRFNSYVVRILECISNEVISGEIFEFFKNNLNSSDAYFFSSIYHIRNIEDSNLSIERAINLKKEYEKSESTLKGQSSIYLYIQLLLACKYLDNNELEKSNSIFDSLNLSIDKSLASGGQSNYDLHHIKSISMLNSAFLKSILSQVDVNSTFDKHREILKEYHHFIYEFPHVFTKMFSEEIIDCYANLVEQKKVDETINKIENLFYFSKQNFHFFGLVHVFKLLTRTFLLQAQDTDDNIKREFALNQATSYVKNSFDTDLVDDLIRVCSKFNFKPELDIQEGIEVDLPQYQRVTNLLMIKGFVEKLSNEEIIKYTDLALKEINGPFSMSTTYDVARSAISLCSVILNELILIDTVESSDKVKNIFSEFQKIIDNKNIVGKHLIIHQMAGSVKSLFSKITSNTLSKDWVMPLLEMAKKLPQKNNDIIGRGWIDFVRPSIALYNVTNETIIKSRIKDFVSNYLNPKKIIINSIYDKEHADHLALPNIEDLLVLVYSAQVGIETDAEIFNNAFKRLFYYLNTKSKEHISFVYPLNLGVYFSMLDFVKEELKLEFFSTVQGFILEERLSLYSRIEFAESLVGWFGRCDENGNFIQFMEKPSAFAQGLIDESLKLLVTKQSHNDFFGNNSDKKLVALNILLLINIVKINKAMFKDFFNLFSEASKSENVDIKFIIANLTAYMAFSDFVEEKVRSKLFFNFLKTTLSEDPLIQGASLRGCREAIISNHFKFEQDKFWDNFLYILSSIKGIENKIVACKILQTISKNENVDKLIKESAVQYLNEALNTDVAIRKFRAVE